MIRSRNPCNGKVLATYPSMTAEETSGLLQLVVEAQSQWKQISLQQRSERLRSCAANLLERSEELACLMAVEMGKPVAAGRSEIEKCAAVCRYYADRSAEFLAPERVPMDLPADSTQTTPTAYVSFQPLGVVLAVMPWNFPFWQVFRFAAPALLAGNGAVLKHASNVPGCALAIEEIFQAAGFPEHLFRTVLVGSQKVGDLIADRRIRAVTLTGSTPAGRAVAARAGQHLKKTVLELGGSDPYLILQDADVAAAARICAQSRLINSGQSCIAAKRFLVVDSVRQEFEDHLVEQMGAYSMGDPLAEDTDLGPQARHDLRDELHRQVQESLKAGARCLLGGEIPLGPGILGNGAFYPATVLTDVQPGMPAYEEELFGPVAAVISVRDTAEAIEVANRSVFGLGAAVFTADRALGEKIAREDLEAGCCVVNDFVRSDPRLPFGGIKDSGYGRELSHWGLREFTNIKSVIVG